MVFVVRVSHVASSRAISRAAGSVSASSASIQLRPAQSRSYSTTRASQKRAWDPSLDTYKYWNRETSVKGEASLVLEMSPDSIQKEARILCLAAEDDDANAPLTESRLPFGSSLLHVGTQPSDFDDSLVDVNPNVLFVSPSCPHARLQVPLMVAKFPSIEWIHVRSAGIDFLESDDLPRIAKRGIHLTNAKGQFSSSLAEYVMTACGYFAKDIPRLLSQKGAKRWDAFDIEELRGKTMGIVGYGDIGKFLDYAGVSCKLL